MEETILIQSRVKPSYANLIRVISLLLILPSISGLIMCVVELFNLFTGSFDPILVTANVFGIAEFVFMCSLYKKSTHDINLAIDFPTIVTETCVRGIQHNLFIKNRYVEIQLDSVIRCEFTESKHVTLVLSNGRVSLGYLEFGTEVGNVLSSLVIENQRKKQLLQPQFQDEAYKRAQEQMANGFTAPAVNLDDAEVIRNFKKLLDDGIITEEEFNEKKRSILNK